MNYKSLEDISKDVKKCKKCDLYKTRNNSVPGIGKDKNKIIFVGEAPGAEEDEKGIPFCGRGGRLLRNTIKEIGVKEDEVYITNLVKCRPPNNRKPTKNEINSCNKYLKEEIRIINPNITVLLGKTAIKKQYEDVKLKEKHGKIIDKEESKYLLTYHPAAILRNQTKIETFIDDLKKIKSGNNL
tara:strand:+ start:10161 stop:10712 length:552 start_codon:yes stop_codon:yes gene_type:complete